VIEVSYLQFESVQIPIKVVKTKNFTPIYDAISQFERKLPARVLRFCKERVYEIVKGQNPDRKIAVVDYDEIEHKDDIEVVFGLGVIGKLGETGYKGISVEDLFEDLIMKNKGFDPDMLIKSTISLLPRRTRFVPIFKYLRELGIISKSDYDKSGFDLDRLVVKKDADFATGSVMQASRYSGYSFSDFMENATESEIVSITPLLSNVDLDVLGDYLKRNYSYLIGCGNRYHFRRLMAYYDWKLYGF